MPSSTTENPPSQTTSSDESALAGAVNTPAAEEESALAAAIETPVFDLTFSENSVLSEDMRKSISEEVKTLGLNKSQAEAMVKRLEETHSTAEQYTLQQQKETQATKKKEFFEAPEFKDEQVRKQNFAKISEVVNKFGDQEFLDYVKSSEGGNNIALARFLLNIQKQSEGDAAPQNNGVSQTGDAKVNPLKARYPGFYKDSEN